MTRILLYGEGRHDIGREDWDKRNSRWVPSDGWLQPIIRNIRGPGDELEARALKDLVLLPSGKVPVSHLSALGRKALAAALRAETDGFAAVVLVTDTDSVSPIDHATKIEDMDTGFEAYAGPVATVAGSPMGMSEAWLLSDAAAWTSLGATDHSERPAHPEQSWGHADDPESGRPKFVFGRMCKKNGLADHSGTRADVADGSDPQEISAKCPISFPPFATSIGALP